MTLKQIKPGKWYLTTLGLGKCLGDGNTHPKSVRMLILAPLPRGELKLGARDVEREAKPEEMEMIAPELR